MRPRTGAKLGSFRGAGLAVARDSGWRARCGRGHLFGIFMSLWASTPASAAPGGGIGFVSSCRITGGPGLGFCGSGAGMGKGIDSPTALLLGARNWLRFVNAGSQAAPGPAAFIRFARICAPVNMRIDGSTGRARYPRGMCFDWFELL